MSFFRPATTHLTLFEPRSRYQSDWITPGALIADLHSFDNARFGFDRAFRELEEYSKQMETMVPKLNFDLIESESDFHIHADLPGVNKENLSMSVENGHLTIEASRKSEVKSESDKVHRVERSSGVVRRVIPLPKNADVEHVNAALTDGVLTVSFPKLTITQPEVKKINIA